jgi:hypothetical protein
MTKPLAWQVDPAWPAVPASAEDDEAPEQDIDVPRQVDLVDQQVSALRQRVAAFHCDGTNLQVKLHHAQRALQAHTGAPQVPTSMARPRRQFAGHHARNDRLLAAFETTPAHLPHLQRCRLAAQILAAEIAASAGLPIERARVLPATTARDAIAEAKSRRG